MEIVSDGLLMKLPSCASFTLRSAAVLGIFSALYLVDLIPIFLAREYYNVFRKLLYNYYVKSRLS